MSWVNAFKAVPKHLAFVCSAKENDLMNGKGRTIWAGGWEGIKKISKAQTGEETVSEPKAPSLLPRNIVF